MSTDAHKPHTGYWHLWADEQGVSHQNRCELTGFEQQSMSGAAPQWNDVQARGEATVIFAVLPVGWVGDWHPNPSLGEDLNCRKDDQGRIGHRSGTVGDEPARLMIVQLHVDPVGAPCHLR